MFACIDQAREYVLLQYYIVHDDELGRELKDRLMARAEQGVRIYFQYDEIGCHKLSKEYIMALKRAGVEMSPFKTTRGRGNRFQLNFRNHRKITVVDGRTAFVGGHNVGDEYMGRNPRFGRWRDTHVKIQGPVVRQVQLSFVKDWYWATRQAPRLNWKVLSGDGNGVNMLALSTGPTDEIDTCALMFVQAIHSAQSRFWLSSPYFVPNEAVLEALQIAALRGVDVRIMLPAKPDHRTVHLAGLSFLPQLDIPGLRLYRYEAGFLHQKAMLIDDSLAAVGTANADNRSFSLNFEITMLVADKDFAAKVEAMFVEDFKNSRILEAEEYHHLGTLTRLGVRIARLFSPLL
jgi:cardiolipin synthase